MSLYRSREDYYCLTFLLLFYDMSLLFCLQCVIHRFLAIRDSAEPCRVGAADQGDSTGHLGIVGV